MLHQNHRFEIANEYAAYGTNFEWGHQDAE
jgi:hypothetical protein